MAKVRNILFIMADQLRADYLSCAGHPTLETPNIDMLAKRGVLFSRAYVQSTVCGPSRMSFYTGRYTFNHGATWNYTALPVGEKTLGEYLRPHDIRTALVGKTHMLPDNEGMQRLGIDPNTNLGVLLEQCGFEPFERDDGLHPDKKVPANLLAYNKYLNQLGYAGDNPWHTFANSALGPDGEILSGWYMRNARLPARVPDEHSETAYITNRAIDFMAEQGNNPWCLHLSFIKPHWPYMVSAPYNDMYSAEDCLPVKRHPQEKENPHPVYQAFMNQDEGQAFSRDEVRETVIPTYMGLVKQIDDHLGRLFQEMENNGRMEDTMIVFTSDHGDHLGDHWLGEKEVPYEQAVRIPMIVYDPCSAADSTRGTIDDRFVEAIDLVPTFLDSVNAPIPEHILEGHSLLPLIHGETPENWRSAVFSELDYSFYKARLRLKLDVDEARIFMVSTKQWKYIFCENFRPLLFDLENDPDEFIDLGADPDYSNVREEMKDLLFTWFRKRKTRTTTTRERIEFRSKEPSPVIKGKW